MRNSCSVMTPRSTCALDVDAVELEALGEHVAEVERHAPRQRLQAHERDQLAEARVDLEELAVLGLHLQRRRSGSA